MKLSGLHFLILSLPAAAVLFPYSNSHAAIRVNNSSALQNKIQMDIARNAPAQPMAPQPARTITNDNGTTTTVSNEQMDACRSIYPNGQFDWAKPTMGSQAGSGATCVALVELRSYKNVSSGTYNVLASDYLAAGDAIKCNVDSFDNLTAVGLDFTYPADEAPTMEEVAKVMAQEQKSNAGFKILGAALVGGIGGNLLGMGEAGSDSPLGTNKEKLKSTAIGAVGAAALMTASTQSNDYKAGSIILSTGVNAAAGAVAGNLVASGDDVLKIADCKIKDPAGTKDENGELPEKTTKCLYGVIELADSGEATPAAGKKWFYNVNNGSAWECVDVKGENGETKENKWRDCRSKSFKDIEFDNQKCNDSCKDEGRPVLGNDFCKKCMKEKFDKYHIKGKANIMQKVSGTPKSDEDIYVIIKEATVVKQRVPAMIEFEGKDKLFGYTYSDWVNDLKSTYKNATIYDARGDKASVQDIDLFAPTMQSADDGAVVDFGNRARTKSTLIGAGGGAALGALSGASGADSAITERWLAAKQEYDASLGNVVCFTGGRFLSQYNETVIIPTMKTQE